MPHNKDQNVNLNKFTLAAIKKLIITFFLMFISAVNVAQSATKPALYAIISPMPIEGEYIRAKMTDKKEMTKLGIHYLTGKINGREVISVISGYGKVNVTMVTSRLLISFKPNAIILAESAGAVSDQLKIGDVVVGTTLFDADFGELTKTGPSLPILIDNPTNHKKEPMIYESDSFLISVVKKSAIELNDKYKIIFGVIADSDFLPNPAWQLTLLRKNKVNAIAMDGVPVTKLGWLFQTPSLVFHCIANIAGQPIKDSDTALASNNMNQLVVKFIGDLPIDAT